MKNIINKSFKGLPPKYYLHHFKRGFLLGIFLLSMASSTYGDADDTKFIAVGLVALVLLIIVSLYPYTRFVYELIIKFIFGDFYWGSPIIGKLVYLFMMTQLFAYTLIISPVSLIYLYIINTIQERKSIQS